MLNVNGKNNVNFTSKLDVRIAENYLNKLKGRPYNNVTTKGLLDGLKLLEGMAPSIGKESDLLKIYSDSTPNLRLQFNNDAAKSIEPAEIYFSIKAKLNEIFADQVAKINRTAVHSPASENIAEINKFNFVA